MKVALINYQLFKIKHMKKITLLIALLTLSISFGQNLIINGDFETGAKAPWLGYKNGIQANTFDAAYGSWLGKVENSDGSLFQAVTVVPTKTYNVTFDYYWILNNNPAAMNVSIKDTPSGAGANLDLSNSDNKFPLETDTETWFSTSFSFVATTASARIVFFKGTNKAPFRLDNVVISEQATASVDDLEQFNFKSYPNPAKNNVYLSAAKNINRIEVYNLLGQKVLYKNVDSKSINLDISNLSKGIYSIKTFIEGNTGTSNFIKI